MGHKSSLESALDEVKVSLEKAIRAIAREEIGDDLPGLVRSVLLEELAGKNVEQNKRSAAAHKAVATRRANAQEQAKPRTSAVKPTLSHAQNALKYHGVAAGQQYKAKSHSKTILGRVIEVLRVDADGIWPKIIHPGTNHKKRVNAKHIKFSSLVKLYERK